MSPPLSFTLSECILLFIAIRCLQIEERYWQQKILLFRNAHYGESEDNQAVLPIRDLSDLLVTNYPGHSPLIEFDGSGGISMSGEGFTGTNQVYLCCRMVFINGQKASYKELKKEKPCSQTL